MSIEVRSVSHFYGSFPETIRSQLNNHTIHMNLSSLPACDYGDPQVSDARPPVQHTLDCPVPLQKLFAPCRSIVAN
jgi:hypothetical protein